jgi:23S rRNA pseudouridine2604 synthase
MAISLNKFIAESGYCSRREADKLIAQGRVTINDMLATVTSKFGPKDIIAVDFEVIKQKKVVDQEIVILAYNKPKGVTSTTDLADATSIMHFVKYPKRIFPIGRLDKDSEGLILLTNNGDLVNKILRAGNAHDKQYLVQTQKSIDEHFVEKMANGVEIIGTKTIPCKVKLISNKKFSITLVQGLNRQIRRMCEALDNRVLHLQRVRIMQLQLGNLKIGTYRKLSPAEVDNILQLTEKSAK